MNLSFYPLANISSPCQVSQDYLTHYTITWSFLLVTFQVKSKGKILSGETIDPHMNSLTPGTAKQYQPLINQWIDYYSKSGDNPFSAPVTSRIGLLTNLFTSSKAEYSNFNTARSVLSLILEPHQGITFGKHPLFNN